MYSTKGLSVIWIIFIVVVSLAAGTSAGYFYNLYLRKSALKERTPTQTTEKETTDTQSLISDYDYAIGEVAGSKYDAQITRTHQKTGKKEVVIASVRKTLKDDLKEFNDTLIEYAIPSNSRTIYFRQVKAQTDNPFGVLWSFDVTTKEFTKMNVNSIYKDSVIDAISPDKKKAVALPIEEGVEEGLLQKLYLLDLEKDDSKLLVKLEGNETLDAGFGGLGVQVEISFIDKDNLEFAVYNHKTGDKEKYQQNFEVKYLKQIIEKRQEKI